LFSALRKSLRYRDLPKLAQGPHHANEVITTKAKEMTDTNEQDVPEAVK
jgi:hypothetical protein